MRLRNLWMIMLLMFVTLTSSSQIIQNFCPIDPSEYNFDHIEDSVEVICDRYVKDVLNDKRFLNATYTFRIEYSFCPTSTELEIAALKRIADSLLPIVRKQFNPLKTEDNNLIIYGGVTPSRFYKNGKTCIDFIGIRIQLLIVDNGN